MFCFFAIIFINYIRFILSAYKIISEPLFIIRNVEIYTCIYFGSSEDPPPLVGVVVEGVVVSTVEPLGL